MKKKIICNKKNYYVEGQFAINTEFLDVTDSVIILYFNKVHFVVFLLIHKNN